MPRHARTCLFLTLSLYMIMHVLNKLSFSLPSIHVHPSASCVCLYMRMYVCMYVTMCVCVCVCVCVRVRAYWSHVRVLYSGRRAWTPPP